MWTIPGPARRYCDGVTRRSFLQVGALACGGLTLPQLLRAADPRKTQRSVIHVYLTGGISHQDTVDLKPNAPDGIRGEFKPIASNVPGMEFCELLPKLAGIADKLAVIRSIVGLRDEHSSFHTLTGYPMGEVQRDRRPHFGSVVSRVQGQTSPVIPAFVDLFPTMQHRPYNSPGPGYLGRAHAGVRTDGEDLASMRLRFVSNDQFATRRSLLRSIDQARAAADSLAEQGMSVAYQRAFDVLTSSELVRALDVEQEDPAVRERYGRGSPKHLGDGAPMWNDQLLIARRLVEAGVRCVTVAYGFWDTHGSHFQYMKDHLPLFDTGISALVSDLHERGLADQVTVAVWGEFGRTPKINKEAGRDHWPRVNSCILAGGGMKTGQVIGSTDKLGDSAASRPVHYHDVIASLYHVLGIDTQEMVRDETDRPVLILPESARPVSELF